MSSKPRALTTLAVGLGMAFATASASAALFSYTLTVADSGSNSFAGSGSITVNDNVALNAFDDTITAFSFTITSIDGVASSNLPVTFGMGNVGSYFVRVGAAPTFGLSLDIDLIAINVNQRTYDLSFDNVSPVVTSVLCRSDDTDSGGSGARVCFNGPDRNDDRYGTSSLQIAYQAPNGNVPVPGTALLLGVGLLGLGALRRRVAGA